jgi:glycosyltransferase involved in cell wall biosynthesis
MNQLKNIAFIGNSLPRRCGIATFTTDLQQAVSKSPARVATAIVAMTNHGHVYDYPPEVRLAIADNNRDDYIHAADVLNAGNFDVACLQHEFGIFGGEDGDLIVALLSRLKMPIVTTLHTVLAEPSSGQRRVLSKIIELSAKVVVMAEKGRTLLSEVFHVPAGKIEVVPHGIPDMPFSEPAVSKADLGFDGRSVILTFGLLSPNKGIEVMIDAMPLILESRPDAVYVILGATHPNLVRDQGEAYRKSLVTRVNDLGIEDSVVFLDRFVDKPTLLDFISMCDVYATPYLNAAQMTSGTLAYSFGLGKAVVSTPYWHAQELLAEGRGVLVPFGDATAIGREIASLLTDDTRRDAMRRRAYQTSRPMTWQKTAERYLALFSQVSLQIPHVSPHHQRPLGGAPPPPSPSRSSATSCRCATILGYSSMRSILCQIVCMVTVSMIMPAHFFCRLLSTNPAKGYCRKHSPRASRPSCSTPGTPTRTILETSWASTDVGWKTRDRKTATPERSGLLANAPVATQAHPGARGPRACFRRLCRLLKVSARHVPGPLRCWDWTAIAQSRLTTLSLIGSV